jgi:quinol monooxygenase YgiN
MIEVHLAYDFMPGVDEKDYFDWIKKAIVPVLKSDGIVEIRACRNIKESPAVLVTGVWKSPEAWTKFSQSETWDSLINTLQNTFAINLRIEVWEPSPFLPEPLRPLQTVLK